ncbi:unnamed protein product, partial [Phaeothamnion confervicola]
GLTTADVLADVLKLMPLDRYAQFPVEVMDRVNSDKDRGLPVPAYAALAAAAGLTDPFGGGLGYVERCEFYEKAKAAFVVVQTGDRSPYANAIVYKGVLGPPSPTPPGASP